MRRPRPVSVLGGGISSEPACWCSGAHEVQASLRAGYRIELDLGQLRDARASTAAHGETMSATSALVGGQVAVTASTGACRPGSLIATPCLARRQACGYPRPGRSARPGGSSLGSSHRPVRLIGFRLGVGASAASARVLLNPGHAYPRGWDPRSVSHLAGTHSGAEQG